MSSPGYYFVNIKADTESFNEHEVHLRDCRTFDGNIPDDNLNYLPLGWHDTSDSAINKSKESYPKAAGCMHCCPDNSDF